MTNYAASNSSTSEMESLSDRSLSDSPLSSPRTPDLGDEASPHLSVGGSLHHQQSSDPSFVLVIGGLGYIGSHTVLELLRAGHNVIVVDSLSNSYESVLANIKTLINQDCKERGVTVPLLHFHRVDYRSRSMRFLLESYADLVSVPTSDESDRQQVTYQSRISGVIHFAAYKSVSESIDKPLAYYKNNVCGLVNLLELLDKHGIHNFIFSSSATVYGAKANAGIPLREQDLVHHETLSTDPVTGEKTLLIPTSAGLTSPYGRTKHMGEAILADLAAADPRWRIIALRYFNPVGCDPSGLLGESPRNVPTNLYPVLTQVLLGDRPQLDVFGSDWDTRDGSAIRDFVHVLDVARGHIAALPKPATTTGPSSPTGFRAYNLGSGTGTTVLEAVRSLEGASGRTIPLALQGRRAGDVGMCVASNERAQRELGWVPRESVSRCAADLWNFVSKATGFGSAAAAAPAVVAVAAPPPAKVAVEKDSVTITATALIIA